MESLWKLSYLLEPASLALIATAVSVAYASASRALDHGKEMERNFDFSEASITLDRSQALMIPLASSCSLLLMFYLFSSVSHLVTAFTAVASVMALFFCLSPYIAYAKSRFNLMDPFVSRCCSKPFTRLQGLLLMFCISTMAVWLVTGHWLLNNTLGISICIAFVSHVRLPNIKICSLLLVCLFVYDVFWVFFSERFFGANVMVSVATQKASNPVHTVADKLSLPGLQLITKKIELPVKLVFPRNLLGGIVPGSTPGDYMMLGLGDMVVVFLRKSPQIYYPAQEIHHTPEKHENTSGSLGTQHSTNTDVEGERAATPPSRHPPGTGATFDAAGEFIADGKLPFSASACSHDGEEESWRSISALESTPSPACSGDEVLERAAGTEDPWPPEVAHATAELRRTTTQKGRHADAKHPADSITASTTPPAGTLPQPTLCTSPDLGFPHPPARRSSAGGGGNPQITGERGGLAGWIQKSPSIYCRWRRAFRPSQVVVDQESKLNIGAL